MKLGEYELNQIYTGDARELANGIPDESVDLIFTDPPYPKKYQGAFDSLGSFSSRVLKNGRRLLTLLGHYQVPSVMSILSATLEYDWIIAYAKHGKTAAMFQKRVWACWKPCLVYRKGRIDNHQNFAMDLFNMNVKSISHAKQFHKWGQGTDFFGYYIERWTKPGDIIIDPFCGGGSSLVACKTLNRNFIGFEIDP